MWLDKTLLWWLDCASIGLPRTRFVSGSPSTTCARARLSTPCRSPSSCHAKPVSDGAFAAMQVKLTVDYEGTAYRGWQIQPNGPTIQGVLEDAALRMFGVSVRMASA